MSRLFTRLDRLILAEIIPPFLGSLMLFTGLFFAAGELVKYASYLQNGVGYLLIAQLILYSFPTIISYTLPMAMLLGTLLGFGRLSGDSEIVALLAAGISFERIAVPVAAFGLAISFVGYWLSASIVPITSYQRHVDLDQAERKGKVGVSTANALTAVERDDKGGMTLIHAEGGVEPSDAGDGSVTMRDVYIIQKSKDAAVSIMAERADWIIGTENWKLINAEGATLGKNRSVFNLGPVSTEAFKLGTPGQLSALRGEEGEVTTPVLRERIEMQHQMGNEGDARKSEVELARRGALPFASLVFAMIGAPLGVSPRREGKGMGFALSVLITFCYWIGLQVFSIVSQGGSINPMVGLAIPNVVCFVIALFLNRRVLRG